APSLPGSKPERRELMNATQLPPFVSSPSFTMSTPALRCAATTSRTAARSSASDASPAQAAGGPGSAPTWVVRILSVLRRIRGLELVRAARHGELDAERARLALELEVGPEVAQPRHALLSDRRVPDIEALERREAREHFDARVGDAGVRVEVQPLELLQGLEFGDRAIGELGGAE